MSVETVSIEKNVSERYAEGASERQAALCCPVDYDKSLLAMLPTEIIEKDYGCGDPSRYVREGDVVLDLGSGGGKICYMAAQLVGSSGRVIGVDMTDEMLALARRHQSAMAEKLGGNKVEFKKGYIQDLALDVDALATRLAQSPVSTAEELNQLDAWKQQQRIESPMVADDSVSLVISNCVLNLVDKKDRQQMIEEIFRVLKPGGRVAISDIICDETVPQSLQNDPTLWSGCISGAFEEQEFLQAFLDAGFVAVGYDKWDDQPWQIVAGIEFRSVTLLATKPSKKHLYDAGQAVFYKGPYSEVRDDLGNIYPRGLRIAVSRRTFELIKEGPYAKDFVCMSPAEEVNHGCFCLPAASLRPASATKGGQQFGTGADEACC
ncbi:methyltransferase domain-containing protein [Oceanicoccus sp. KOV_DT_Chl]|uniref:methyltransferase domain-containing protein n=1 Tax=Oceanicoccus sp. KOV_DT_Chl TaxID=1904639 RepID=UPI000C7A8F36|nr:methyltransferase domain-containing protein [Oceanicoccus sp. KOV_DT_Chl]